MLAIETIEKQAMQAIESAKDIAELEQIRVEYLGKKGYVTDLMKHMAQLSAEEKPKFGQLVNQVKAKVTQALEQTKSQLKERELGEKLARERIDVTLPGRNNKPGTLHPVTQVKHFVMDFFTSLGFDIVTGPEIETDFYNFEALNIPGHHPARAMHDTFYFGDGRLLRTHTSPVQIRAMENKQPPLRLIAPGRVYRCDSDMTHTPMFHQVEGLVIEKSATMSQLRGLLQNFFQSFFGKSLELRFRPSYFPFTEPSAEVDITCTQCHGKGCRTCKFTGWLEVLGCGMVHPKVLQAVHIDPAQYQGFAFGLGMDRLAMLYFGIDDLRTMFENELAFLEQF